MSDMELVIKIDDKLYNRIKCLESKTTSTFDKLMRSVLNGIPLPKGHGALKDTDTILNELEVVSSRPVKSQLYIIRQAPTLVEADKASEVHQVNDNENDDYYRGAQEEY